MKAFNKANLDHHQEIASFWNARTLRASELGSYCQKCVDYQIRPELKRCGKQLEVLDLGCGNGLLSIFLAQNYGFQVTGVDISQTAIEFARETCQEQNAKVTFLNVDILDESLDLPKYDLIIGHAVLHEFVGDDFGHLAQFLTGHVREDGYCSFLENNYFNFIFRYTREHLIGKKRVSHRLEYPFDRKRYSVLKEHFMYIRRDCPAVNLLDRFYWQLWPQWIRLRPLASAATFMDYLLTIVLPSSLRVWASYLQIVSFSQCPLEDRLHTEILRRPWYPVYRI